MWANTLFNIVVNRFKVSRIGFMQVNILALSICTRESYKMMKENNIDDGHIFFISRYLPPLIYINWIIPDKCDHATLDHCIL